MSEQIVQVTRGQEFPRQFLPLNTDLGQVAELEKFYQQLLVEIQVAASIPALQSWLCKWSEWDAVLSEEMARRYIAMTCYTENKDFEAAFLSFVENVQPKLKAWNDELSRAFVTAQEKLQWKDEHYAVFEKRLKNQIQLFRSENIPLQTEDEKLGQQYQKLVGSQTVQWEGEEKTLKQVAPLLEETDRALREEVWKLSSKRRMQDVDAIDSIYDGQIALRHQRALNAGFKNFRDYQHLSRERFDYSAQDCLQFHKTIQQYVVPLVEKIRERRKKQMGLASLRPWDLGVDALGRKPLRPFQDGAQLAERCAAVFQKMDPELGGYFQKMRDLKLLDLENRKGKGPGGYNYPLEEIRMPFIFMNASGSHSDVVTLFHEGGHAFHTFLGRKENFTVNRDVPIEFCEVASMSMEFMTLDSLASFYDNTEEQRRAYEEQLERSIDILPWIAIIDAFQHWVYLNPKHSRAERAAKFSSLMDTYYAGVDWSGFENEKAYFWQKQSHLFNSPFYYIEYGIAMLGALQMWLQWRENCHAALKNYKHALSLGAVKPLPQLFAAAKINFDFSPKTVQPIVEVLQRELSF